MMNYILASASPRRKELLAQAGIKFTIKTSNEKELITEERPKEIVCELARQKGVNVLKSLSDIKEDTVLISADTIVVYQDQILGKPADEEDAFRTLSLLSGNTHQVYTGVCLTYFTNGHWISDTFYEKTDVTFLTVSEAEIKAYIASKDPMDKAGSYGIQGPFAVHIEGISGDYNNVVGMPIARLYHELKARNLL